MNLKHYSVIKFCDLSLYGSYFNYFIIFGYKQHEDPWCWEWHIRTYFNVKGRFGKQITQHTTQWLKQSFKTTMKQFCGLGKEEPLSSWSNSKHPLTIIHCVVSDFWKSEVLKNNRIWKISLSSSFLPSLWQQTPQWDKNTLINTELFFWNMELYPAITACPFCLTQTTVVV